MTNINLNEPWVGVDLDGTLAEYNGWVSENHIGKPIPLMVQRVKAMLKKGTRVKIFTARVCREETRLIDEARIKAWCLEHIGQELEVTNIKDYKMIKLYDDRAIQVIPNTGITVDKDCAGDQDD